MDRAPDPQVQGALDGAAGAVVTGCPGFDSSKAAKRAVTNGTIIVGAFAQRAATSIDGVRWTGDHHVRPSADANALELALLSIAVGNGTLVAAASCGVMSSMDGLA